MQQPLDFHNDFHIASSIDPLAGSVLDRSKDAELRLPIPRTWGLVSAIAATSPILKNSLSGILGVSGGWLTGALSPTA